MEAFAIDVQTDKIIHISNASKNAKYICTVCKTQLFPVKGNFKRRHFRHKSVKEHQQRKNAETRLHREAKQILKFFELVDLPDELGPAELTFVQLEESHVRGSHRIRPDVSAFIGSKKIFIEIKVTHGVSEDKCVKLVALNIDTIEIDLSMYVGRETLSARELQMAVVFDAPRKYVHRCGFHFFSHLMSRWCQFWSSLLGLIERRRTMKLVSRDPDSGQSFWDF